MVSLLFEIIETETEVLLGSIRLLGFLTTWLRKNLFVENPGPTVVGSAF